MLDGENNALQTSTRKHGTIRIALARSPPAAYHWLRWTGHTLSKRSLLASSLALSLLLLSIANEIPMTISPLKPRFVGLTGLPRSGSTLLSQLLAQHPGIHCDGASSPLCNMLLGIRRMVSDDTFFLAQLDSTFDASYGHLASAMRGFLQSWHHDAQSSVVVDKNRAWLHAIELLLHIEPEARLIVCLRELGQIYGSIEAQHQRTILVDFIDHLADFDRFGRADMLFAKDKVIGAPLISIHAVPDLPKRVQERLYFVRFEDLMDQPIACLSHLYSWLGLPPREIDLESLTIGPQESDSHYRMKFLHRQSARLVKPAPHEIPVRIQKQIETAYAWFYQTYYPKPA